MLRMQVGGSFMVQMWLVSSGFALPLELSNFEQLLCGLRIVDSLALETRNLRYQPNKKVLIADGFFDYLPTGHPLWFNSLGCKITGEHILFTFISEDSSLEFHTKSLIPSQTGSCPSLPHLERYCPTVHKTTTGHSFTLTFIRCTHNYIYFILNTTKFSTHQRNLHLTLHTSLSHSHLKPPATSPNSPLKQPSTSNDLRTTSSPPHTTNMPPKKIITTIGSLNLDLVTTTPRIPSAGETMTGLSFSTFPGGKGSNQAVAASRLSNSSPTTPSTTTSPPSQTSESDILVKMIGSVGSDDFGPTLLSALKNSKVDTEGVRVEESYKTGIATILVDSSTGENRIILAPGANHSLTPSQFTTAESLGSPKPDLLILQLEIPFETVLQIIRTAKKAGVPILLNPAPAVKLPEEVYEGLDYLVLNETETAILAGRSVEDLLRPDFDFAPIKIHFHNLGVKTLIITLGSRGAFFSSSSPSSRTIQALVPAAKVEKVVDTTAAGDTFVGAFAVGVVRGWTGKEGGIKRVVEWACKASARAVEKSGAQSSIPWGDEVGGLGA